MDICRCGHERAAHAHYRPGTDCAECDCRRFRARHPVRVVAGRISRALRGRRDA